MYYVYFLKSKIKRNWVYVGYTSTLRSRLHEHQIGNNTSTKPYCPLVLDSYVALSSRKRAKELEKYFKKDSGKAILKKRILSDEALA